MTQSLNQQIRQPQSSKESFSRLVQLLLAGVGIFSALCYFLGRLHLEAYYYALGITPRVLHFAPEDYMFSSFNLIIMCLFICYWLYTYYTHARAGEKIFFGLPVFRSSSKEELAINILMIVVAFFFAVSTFLNIYLGKGIGANVPGVLGFTVGFAIGIAAIFYLWFLETSFGKRTTYVGLVIVGLMLLALLPSIATALAKIEAKLDMEKFPQAILICEDVLPNELQSSPSTPTKSSEVKLIITNNGMTYVLKQDGESTDEWQIYAIQQDDIKQIIYLLEK